VTAEPLAAAAIEVRRSRFYAHLYRVEGPQDVAAVLAGHREAYRKAAHHCAAFRCGALEEFKNDAEVGRAFRDAGEAAIREAGTTR
jgi:putative IMPACT (imprinted ancient) family translation regulator